MTLSNVRLTLLFSVGVFIALLSGCVEPEVVTASGQRVSSEESVAVQGFEPQSAPTDVSSDQETPAENTPADRDADVGDSEQPAVDEEPTPTPPPVPTATPAPVATDATVPSDVCDETAEAPIADAIDWADIDLGRETGPEPATYVNSTGDANSSFVEGTLTCTLAYVDGSALTISTYSNYDARAYGGTRLSGFAAGALEILVAADPQNVRAIVEYPWAPSPTGLAALEVLFNDPDGIDAAEVDAIEQVAIDIRDRIEFAPPTVAGPAYPNWYSCSLTRFGTAQGDTVTLAAALGQGKGLHAEETIDRQLGTSRCSLYEGPGTSVSGGFAIDEIFVALAAYESGRSTFNDTVQQVRASPGVVQGELTVAGTTYRTFAAPGSFAVILESGGNGVISVFDPAMETTLPELQAIMTPILQQLFG